MVFFCVNFFAAEMAKDANEVICPWADKDEILRLYHNTEWGIPVHDDYKMFEYLSLECFQCGLSWRLMLKKRGVLKQCFSGFDYDRVAQYNETTIQHILNTEGMIHSERKIRAVIHNARCYQRIREKYGSFCHYLWHFSEGKTILYDGHSQGHFPISNGLSDKISRDLKKQGFQYVGTITMYSHLQACGIINDHVKTCPCYQEIISNYPIVQKAREHEIYKRL